MNSIVRVIVIVFAMVSLAGCAHMGNVKEVLSENAEKEFSDFGFKDAEEAIAMEAPIEWELQGITAATIIIGALNPALFPEYPEEVIAEKKFGGVWPSVAGTKPVPTRGKKLFYTDKGPKGVHLTLTIFPAALDIETPIIDLSRDGSLSFSQLGVSIPGYQIKKFQQDEKHRNEVFSAALTIQEINDIWTSYFNGRSPLPFVRTVQIPSPEWEKVKELLQQILPCDYKMSNGKVWWGYIPIEKYKTAASKSHGVTTAQRFVKEFRPDILSFIFNPIGAAVDNASRVVTSAAAAKFDKTWSGPYMQAEGKKESMSNTFLLLNEKHQDEIKKREQVIQDQAARIKALERNK